MLGLELKKKKKKSSRPAAHKPTDGQRRPRWRSHETVRPACCRGGGTAGGVSASSAARATPSLATPATPPPPSVDRWTERARMGRNPLLRAVGRGEEGHGSGPRWWGPEHRQMSARRASHGTGTWRRTARWTLRGWWARPRQARGHVSSFSVSDDYFICIACGCCWWTRLHYTCDATQKHPSIHFFR